MVVPYRAGFGIGRNLFPPRGPSTELREEALTPAERLSRWNTTLEEQIGSEFAAAPILFCGQDAAFAEPLAQRFVTVGGIITELEQRMRSNLEMAIRSRALGPGAPLAESHQTRYPLLQGPMTRVSDTAAFAGEVAEAGALPFLAMALMRGPEAEKMLAETAERLQGRPWGVGLLGFLPAEIRRELEFSKGQTIEQL